MKLQTKFEEILNLVIQAQPMLIDEIAKDVANVSDFVKIKNKEEIAKECVKLCLEEQIKTLKTVFESLPGEIDDTCSKDDLIDEFNAKIKELQQRLNNIENG